MAGAPIGHAAVVVEGHGTRVPVIVLPGEAAGVHEIQASIEKRIQ